MERFSYWSCSLCSRHSNSYGRGAFGQYLWDPRVTLRLLPTLHSLVVLSSNTMLGAAELPVVLHRWRLNPPSPNLWAPKLPLTPVAVTFSLWLSRTVGFETLSCRSSA